MMTMKLRANTDDAGHIRLDVPLGLPNQQFDIIITAVSLEDEQRDELGYPLGYFNETYGILAGEPMERAPQLPFDVRDNFE